ncbi:cilia- and flagella-associated protein 251-like [Sphaeramia orbicularis]|uniref:cilia- and flagella-associated protein 251-like n=1 Tax=Sphaeramia orbicularis TaxID=375764 RepID=UPI00117D4BDF|nr:cilia- and flagella-associated protein 251-like [Sphaeramia orbicularis]XP_030018358.1 cilia- and flagella-associated protein 251-like [Sphaeramia orbicularis]XP_030018359.1 cilia- and flagella-associated protein 251-like [Sphaeramia orbicularis]
MADIDYKSNTNTVLILLFVLLGLVVLLFFLYKVLNKEAKGEYTIRRMVYKEGGVRDRVRGVAIALGTRIGIQMWPHSGASEDEEEMEEFHSEERQMEQGSRKEDSHSDEEEEEEEEQGKGDASSLESSDGGEQTRLVDETEAKGSKEEKEEKVGDGEGKGETSGGAGLLIDLKQFSGSAIWSEEEGGEGKDRDVTAL